MDSYEDMVNEKTKIDSLIAEIRDDVMRLPFGPLLQFAAHKAFLPSSVREESTVVLRTAEDGVRYTEYL